MCTVCGCSGEGVAIHGDHSHAEGAPHDHKHPPHNHDHSGCDHHHHEDAAKTIHFGAGVAGAHAPGQSQSRLIQIEQDILSKNDSIAAVNRQRLQELDVLAINLMSSPGSGKTTLLVESIKALCDAFPISVIEGDQQTSNDAARIRETGVSAVQVNTGKGCHLDAEMVNNALDQLDLEPGGILFIENVGNLVCPASFDLGEARRVVLASVTEGEDKPLKYPEMFSTSDAMVVSKTDLLPHLDFSVTELIENGQRIRPDLQVMQTNAKTPDGLLPWLDWLRDLRAQVSAQHRSLAAAE